MTRKTNGWRTAWALCLGLLASGAALAGPEGGVCWQRWSDCPRSEYSPLHYWAPSLYPWRALVHPSNLDQYPPGPAPAVAPSFDVNRYRCRSIPPTATAPYADPAAYYGLPTAPR